MASGDFTGIRRAIYAAPQTWIPGLLIACVRAAVAKGCFQPGKLIDFVRDAEATAIANCRETAALIIADSAENLGDD